MWCDGPVIYDERRCRDAERQLCELKCKTDIFIYSIERIMKMDIHDQCFKEIHAAIENYKRSSKI